ncbi:MAG: hypothetical protein BGO95_00835 [Micrococcales bacterium 73-13]|mgnify:CR=1 FL=1|nr:MAG: hypothetical protein BGO95_00835 [Micrococcales bacterium 73-13]
MTPTSAIRVAALVLAALGPAVGGAGALPAAPALAAQSADVDDFAIESFDAAYELGRDAEGRSTLRTVERIVAVFPDFDQNRGIVRDLPRRYADHDTELAVRSVTDEHGVPRPFTTEADGNFLSVVIAVPEGGFAHGRQSYVIDYTQRDVTGFFQDTGVDEFYWDVNGTGWAQPFGRVSARLVLSPELSAAMTGGTACYRGRAGSGRSCELSALDGAIVVDERGLGPYENVTIAVAFAPGTFTAPPEPFLERVPLLVYGGLASLGGAILLVVLIAVRWGRGVRTGRAIIAQYEPPEGIGAAVAAQLLRVGGRAMTATLLDLAVRRRLRLLHDEPTGLYGVQSLTDEGLLPIEHSAYRRIFGGAGPGATLWFQPADTRLGDAAAALRAQAREAVRQAGLVGRVSGWLIGAVALLLVLALALPVLHAIVTGDFVLMTILLAVGGNLIVWVLVFVLGGLSMLRPRTMAGALLHDHLMGLREYIRLAEADRIRMLQSASGAELDEHRVVRVYERLLPYAVLFGMEREWQAELARYYRESTPEWVGGASSSVSFSRSLSIAAFGSTVASSPVTRTSSGSGSGSSFSSSSGGSSGGGSSGGGGGGGGGHGI